MQISELLQLEKKKKELSKKKGRLMKKRLKQKQLQQINIDHSSVKKGFIQKTKIIKKKQYEKVVEKGRKIAIQIQDNVNVNTFLADNQNFTKIYERTKRIINLDKNLINKASLALNAYATEHKQSIIQLHLIFQNQIQCSLRPYQMKLPYKNSSDMKNNWIIVLVKNAKTIDKSQNFKKVLGMIEIVEINQFIKAWKNDKKFKKKIDRERPLILCEFAIFKVSKFIQSIMNKNYMVFPLQTKKVPYCLQETFKNYEAYISFLISHEYTLIKSGSDHTVHLKARQNEHLAKNIEEAAYIFVAKSIERNKNKGNRLIRAQIKTKSSIPFQIYKYERKNLPQTQQK